MDWEEMKKQGLDNIDPDEAWKTLVTVAKAGRKVCGIAKTKVKTVQPVRLPALDAVKGEVVDIEALPTIEPVKE